MLPLHAGPGDQIAPFTPMRLLTAWTFEPVLLAVIIVVGGLYLYGVHRLKARGDKWPVGRTIAFVGLENISKVQGTELRPRVRRYVDLFRAHGA